MVTLTLLHNGLEKQFERLGVKKMSAEASKRQEQPKKQEKPKEDFIVQHLPLSEIFKGRKFDSFDDLRQRANKAINHMRNDWLKSCLMKHGIVYDFDNKRHTKRQLYEMFDKNDIRVVKEKDHDVVYLKEKIIGKWSNKRELHFGERTERFYAKIEYYIK